MRGESPTGVPPPAPLPRGVDLVVNGGTRETLHAAQEELARCKRLGNSFARAETMRPQFQRTGPSPENPQLIEILRALRAFLEPGQITELRALGVVSADWKRPHTVSGYFDDPEKLAAAAIRLNAKGVYFVPNPIKPDLLARSVNRARPVMQGDPTTSDAEIKHRRWLLIDGDPTRAPGISASDKEHEIALAKVWEIRDALSASGWPVPIVADSGNGGHAAYRIDVAWDDGGLIRQVLLAIAFRFDEPAVIIDQTVHNPARILKLYGTMARKGDSTPERPHRPSRLLEVPDQLDVVPLELLEALAKSLPADTHDNGSRASTGRRQNQSFDLDRWIVDHGLDVIEPSPWQGGRRWVFRACPWNSDHRDRSAYIVELPSGAIAAGCHHNGCTDRDWHALRDLYEPGWRARSPGSSSTGNGGGDVRKSQRGAAGKQGPTRFWEGQSFRPALLADELIELNHYVAAPIAEDGVGAFLYAYRNGVFERGEEVASKNAESLFEIRASNARIEDAVKLIRRRMATAHEKLNPQGLDLINVENGMLNWKTGALLSHDPTYLSTIRIPVRFDPSARSQIIDRVLGDWFPSDALELAGEMLGHLLIPTRKYQVAFMLVGEGENGKSTFINLMRSFLGRVNVASETLQELEENRFRVASLFGKLANLCADIDERALQCTGVFKKVTGGDAVSGERKHQHPFEFDPFARFVFSANTPPAPKYDRTHAFFRRWVVVPFSNSFRDEKKRDRDLLEKITAPEALSSLLNIALAGLQRLEDRRDFALPESVREAGERYRRDADAIYTFVMDECGRGGSDAYMAGSELYRSFSLWCVENGYRSTPPKRALEQQFVELLGVEKDRARVGGRKNPVAVWRGITCSYSPSAKEETGRRADLSAEES